jgi:chloride channel protein, CIC family
MSLAVRLVSKVMFTTANEQPESQSSPDAGVRNPLLAWAPRLFRRFWSSPVAGTAGLAAIVGVISGLGAVAFIEIIFLFQRLFFVGGANVFSGLGRWYVVLLPVIGGLLVGPLVYFFAPEAKGHGVPEVMTAMETRGGRIRPVVILVKTIASALTIGSGGSAGREGPIIQIGAAVGSNLGQLLKIDRSRLLTLVAAGAAGGIAATFNAPIAGVMFVLEVLVVEFNVASVSGMVFASVSASVVARQFLGDYPAFQVPPYELVSNWELLMYLGLGVLAAGGALLYMRSLYFSEDVFDRWWIPGWAKPPIAGIAIGLIGYFFPQVFGTGFAAIDSVLRGELGLSLLVALVFAKIAATSLTLGSGFSGGVFAPALFVGAMLGGAYGEIMHSLFPTVTASSGAYAAVGMAAVFAGAARAPVTAIVILFEMTLDYKIMLPLMFATVVATLLAARFEPESIYTLKLVRRGIDFMGQRTDRLRPISVSEAMTPLDETWVIGMDMSLQDLRRYFQESGHRGAVVLDSEGLLEGVVTLSDLERALVERVVPSEVAAIRSRTPMTAFRDETLDEVLKQAGMLEVGYIPVVAREHPREPVGILLRSDIIRAYGSAISARDRRRVSFERRRLEHVFGLSPLEIVLEDGDPGVGRTLRDINPPPESVIVSIIRADTPMVPRGETKLQAGDRVMALALGDGGPILGRILKGRNYH